MTLRRDRASRIYSADFKGGTAERLHVSLRTTRKDEAMRAHAALEAFYRQSAAHPDLLDQLRRRKLDVRAIVAAHEAHRPFAALRSAERWPTFAEAERDYLAWFEHHPKRAASTYAHAVPTLRAARAFFGAETRLDEVTLEDGERYQRHLSASFAPGTVGQYLIRLQALYTFAAAREARRAQQQNRAPRLLHVPLTPELRPAVTQTRVRFLAAEEAERLLAATPERLLFAVGAGLFAGLRLQEMLHLRPPPADVDLEVGQILIQVREDWQPKTRRNREVPIASPFRPIVERHAAAFASDAWMMPSLTGGEGPAGETWFRHQIQPIIERAGLTYGHEDPMGVSYHTLRHTFASWMVMEGVDLFTVAKLLGHASTKMVEQVYGHLAPEHRRWAVDRLAKRLPAFPAGSAEQGAPPGTARDTENAAFAETRG